MRFCRYSTHRFAKRIAIPYVPRAVCMNFKSTCCSRVLSVRAFPCLKLSLFLFQQQGGVTAVQLQTEAQVASASGQQVQTLQVVVTSLIVFVSTA